MVNQSVVSAILFVVVSVFSSIVAANDIVDSQRIDTSILSPYKQLHYLATNGSATAQYELGLLYEYGRGVKQDDAVAVFWYEKSASQFFTKSLYRLAILYDNGWGPKQDKEKALNLYKTAAEKGHNLAQHDLAIIYFQGAETPKNLFEAYKWLKIAVIGGNPLMGKHLRIVAQEMTSEEIEIAEYLALEWLEGTGI